MIIDIHTHVGVSWKRAFHNLFPTGQTAKDLVLKMELYGIDYAVTFPFEPTLYDDPRYYDQIVPTGFMDFPYKVENQILLSQVKNLGGNKLLPLLSIDPQREIKKQIEQIDGWIKEFEIYGFKVHTKSTLSKATTLIDSPFVDLARQNKFSFLFHSYLQEVAHPIYVLEFALKYPEINVCVAHCGGFSQDFFKALEQERPKNVFIDFSPFTALCTHAPIDAKKRGFRILDLDYSRPQEVLRALVERYGNYLTFGSDEPFTTYLNPLENSPTVLSNLGKELQIVKTLSEEPFKLLTFTNAKRFLGERFELKLKTQRQTIKE